MSNPIDDYLEEREKIAGPAGFMGKMVGGAAEGVSAKGLGLLGAHTALTAGAMGGVAAVQKIYHAITKKKHFNEMMEANPDLQEFQRENSSQFNQHYTSLRSMNPTFASDPIVAGTYMRQMSMQPATAGKVVVESLGGVPAGGGVRDFTGALGSVQKGLTEDPRGVASMGQEARAQETHPYDLQIKKYQAANPKQPRPPTAQGQPSTGP